MELIKPFSYCFGSKVIEEDLSELEDCDLFINGREQGDQEVSHLPKNPYRVLDYYPYSKEVITEYFNNFVRNNFEYTSDGYEGVPFKLTTSWMTKLGKGDKIHLHNHQNCMWSGVFYFDEYTEKDVGLSFQNPIPKDFQFVIGRSKWNPMTKDVTVQPEHNLLIFFPSFLYHYGDRLNESEGRKSLAFNFVPTGLYGIGDSSYNPAWVA